MSDRRGFRHDVQGLRAVAILAVVLFHAGVPGVGGGFVGVDVFFVVSGFLITGLLWDELRRTGHVSLAAFYARRARRLLPAASLVLVATLVAAVVVLSPLQGVDVCKDALAAALYVANYRFAVEGTDYLAPDSAQSPLQHYWSLGVEEQFYLVWPVLLVAAAPLGRGVRPSRRGALRALGLVGLGSLAAAVHLTDVSQPWAFFSLPTRAWELAAGGVVALAVPHLRRLPPPIAAAVGWAGVALVVWSVVTTSADGPFPGTAALAPVLGTAAVLVAGCVEEAGRLGPERVLRLRPLQVIGAWSYSWYLWHWPVLVLATAAVGSPLPLPARLGLAAATALLAGLTVRFVENPVRFARPVRRSAIRGLALGAALTLASGTAAVAVAASVPTPRGHGRAVTAADLTAAVHTHLAHAGTHAPPASGATTAAPGSPATRTPAAPEPPPAPDSATAAVTAAVAASLQRASVPANLRPPLAWAAADKVAAFTNGCHLGWRATVPRTCVSGAATSSTTVMVVGDSHATQWEPALDEASREQGWRVVSLTKSTCPPALLPLWSPVLHRPYRECDEWHQQVLARVQAERPALVVLGSARHYGPEYRFQMYGPEWVSGLARMVTAVRESGAGQVVVLGPIPHPPGNVPNCLAAHLGDVPACTLTRSAAVNAVGTAAESAAVTAAGGAYLDVTPWFCAGPSCAVVVDDMLVYRDDNHLTTSYATWLAPLLLADLEPYVATLPGAPLPLTPR